MWRRPIIVGILPETISKLLPSHKEPEAVADTPKPVVDKFFSPPAVDHRFIMSRANQSKPSEAAPPIHVNSQLLSDINKLNPDEMEDVDISSLVKSGNITSIVEQLSPSLSGDIGISMEDIGETDMKNVCAICRQDKASENPQLIECKHCGKKYHTRCLGLPQIPYNDFVPVEKRKREAYVGVLVLVDCRWRSTTRIGTVLHARTFPRSPRRTLLQSLHRVMRLPVSRAIRDHRSGSIGARPSLTTRMPLRCRLR